MHLWEIRNAFIDFKVHQAESSSRYCSIQLSGKASLPLLCFIKTCKKIGVEMQIFKVGTYKSAVEPFISTEMSPGNREQVTAFINSIWGQVTEGVSASRSLPVDSLNALADRMLMFYPAEESVQCGLADTLIYRNDVRNYLKQWVDLKEDDRLPVLGLSDMINVKKNMPKDKSGNIVAVYYASGEITDYSGSSTSEEGIVGTKVIRDLRKLKDDEDVKAVVLRVNSARWKCFCIEQIVSGMPWKRTLENRASNCFYG